MNLSASSTGSHNSRGELPDRSRHAGRAGFGPPSDGPAIAVEAADWAAETIDGLERGPDLGPLGLDEIIPDGKCHPNDAGRLVLGEPLVAFFDGQVTADTLVAANRAQRARTIR